MPYPRPYLSGDDIARRLAAMDPYVKTAGQYGDDSCCAFCDANGRAPHDRGCLWVEAHRTLGNGDAAERCRARDSDETARMFATVAATAS